MTGYSITPEQLARSRAALTKALGGKKPKVVILSDTSTFHGPLHDEGRALVEKIIARKRAHNTRQRFIQQVLWGSVQTDGHGNVIPRELPEYWKHLRQAAVSGGGVEYTKSLNKPERISVKIEGTRTAVAWLDEITRGLGAHLSHDPHLQVREVVTRYELTPAALTVPDVGPVRWSYRAHPPRFGTGAWFEAEASDILSGKSSMDELVQKIRSTQLERARAKGLL